MREEHQRCSVEWWAAQAVQSPTLEHAVAASQLRMAAIGWAAGEAARSTVVP